MSEAQVTWGVRAVLIRGWPDRLTGSETQYREACLYCDWRGSVSIGIGIATLADVRNRLALEVLLRRELKAVRQENRSVECPRCGTSPMGNESCSPLVCARTGTWMVPTLLTGPTAGRISYLRWVERRLTGASTEWRDAWLNDYFHPAEVALRASLSRCIHGPYDAEADALMEAACMADPDFRLPHERRVQRLLSANRVEAALKVANEYAERWPDADWVAGLQALAMTASHTPAAKVFSHLRAAVTAPPSHVSIGVMGLIWSKSLRSEDAGRELLLLAAALDVEKETVAEQWLLDHWP